jgi:toxin-antitoxin system PIN domain toxin
VSRVALLDVNVLVALFDPDHVHHDLAHDWFAGQKADGWATCPLTENGFVRVLTSPSYASPPNRPAEVIASLQAFQLSGGHHFWPARASLADRSIFNPAYIRGHRQLTDIYLLGLAKMADGRLATFDRTIPLGAVKDAAKSTLLVIAPSESS